MKVIILVAGYNTRLLKLTNNVPKALLHIAGIPIIEKILARVLKVDYLSEICIVSNSKFFPQFDNWLQGYISSHQGLPAISLLDDGTSSNETRLGAVGDLLFVLQKKKIDEDIMLFACDNLFEADLNAFYTLSREKSASIVAGYRFGSVDDVRKKFGVMQIADDNRVITFQEKPEEPLSSIAATAMYVFRKEHLRYIQSLGTRKAEKEINLGEIIIQLLASDARIYCDFVDSWFDIGSPEDLKKADEYFGGK
jgi:glucose-1-phosphate thymidylyltransferase